jgi:hypothetical protein
MVSTVAGDGCQGAVNGIGKGSTFSQPTSVAIYASTVFITDHYKYQIRLLDTMSKTVTNLKLTPTFTSTGNDWPNQLAVDIARVNICMSVTPILQIFLGLIPLVGR